MVESSVKVFAFILILFLIVNYSVADSIVPYNSYLNFITSLTGREARFEPKQELEKDSLDLAEPTSLTTGDLILEPEPTIRDQEYIEHSSLFGHQFMTGGAGEGTQRLKPDGSIPNIQVIKSDSVLPAYCNPPNPCPPGYSEEDGCIEDFTNTAAFSKNFQAQQQCICDTEHMFDCSSSSDDSELDELSKNIRNDDLAEETVENEVGSVDEHDQRIYYSTDDDSHKVVAKKFFSKRTGSESNQSIEKKPMERSKKREVLQGNHQIHHMKNFPWLRGELTPQIMAKKSPIYTIHS